MQGDVSFEEACHALDDALTSDILHDRNSVAALVHRREEARAAEPNGTLAMLSELWIPALDLLPCESEKWHPDLSSRCLRWSAGDASGAGVKGSPAWLDAAVEHTWGVLEVMRSAIGEWQEDTGPGDPKAAHPSPGSAPGRQSQGHRPHANHGHHQHHGHPHHPEHQHSVHRKHSVRQASHGRRASVRPGSLSPGEATSTRAGGLSPGEASPLQHAESVGRRMAPGSQPAAPHAQIPWNVRPPAFPECGPARFVGSARLDCEPVGGLHERSASMPSWAQPGIGEASSWVTTIGATVRRGKKAERGGRMCVRVGCARDSTPCPP